MEQINFKCHKDHNQKPLQIAITQNNELKILCAKCLLKEDSFKIKLLIEDIISSDEKDIIENWPPIPNDSIFEKLQQILQNSDQEKNDFIRFCDTLKGDFIKSIDIIQKTVIDSYSKLCDDLVNTYNLISYKKELKEAIKTQNSLDQDFMNLYNRLYQSSSINQSILERSLYLQNQIRSQKEFFQQTNKKFKKELNLLSLLNDLYHQNLSESKQLLKEKTSNILKENQSIKEIKFCQNDQMYQLINFSKIKEMEQIQNGQSDISIQQLISKQYDYFCEKLETNFYTQKLLFNIEQENFQVNDQIIQNQFNFKKIKDSQVYAIGYIDCLLNNRIRKEQFFVKIHRLEGQIFVGIANKIDFTNHELYYKSMDSAKDKLLYMISSNGYSWFSQSDDQFNKKIPILFQQDNVISIQVDFDQIIFSNLQTRQQLHIQVDFQNSEEIVPVFILSDQGDEIEFINM